METKATNAEASIALLISNVSKLVLQTLEQYESQLKTISEHLKTVSDERDNLRVENDSLHAQLNQVEPDPLTEK